jgi:hypothetical protein
MFRQNFGHLAKGKENFTGGEYFQKRAHHGQEVQLWAGDLGSKAVFSEPPV